MKGIPKFRCIVCGRVQGITYANPEECIRTKTELMKWYKDYPEHFEALKKSKERKFYSFTICHGIFLKVEPEKKKPRK